MKKELCTVDITMSKDIQVENALQLFAANYSFTNMLGEYIKNSIDSFLKMYHDENLEDPESPEIDLRYDSGTHELSIQDNGSGMSLETLKSIAANIFDSNKEFKKAKNIRKGIGSQAYRAYYRKITFTTRESGGDAYEMTLQRGAENLRKIPICSVDEFPESGTRVVFSYYEPIAGRPDADLREAKSTIESRLQRILNHRNINLRFFEDSKELDTPAFRIVTHHQIS